MRAARGQVAGEASTTIARSAATLPDDVREKLTRRRKAGDEDAAVDPLTQPEICRGGERQLRGAGRVPADRGAVEVQRDSLIRPFPTRGRGLLRAFVRGVPLRRGFALPAFLAGKKICDAIHNIRA